MDICQLYNEGVGIAEIARRVGISSRTIQRRLKEAGCWEHGRKGAFRRKSKHSYAEHFFDCIDNEAKAYWLGFIAADGAITIDRQNRHYLRFHLSIEDIQHLEKFKSEINATYEICTKEYLNQSPSCSLVICGSRIVKSLCVLGMTPKKTRTISWPLIPDHLFNHFCRGYFDGDGCWHIQKGNQLRFVAAGNAHFMQAYQQVMITACDLSLTKLNFHTETCCELVYGGNKSARRIFDWLYKDASIYMERKYLIASAFLSSLKEPE